MITPARLREARALLDWRQSDSARAASVSRPTVADFEAAKLTPIPNNLTAIVMALESAGIQFGDDGGVRLGSNGQ
jgi:predicted transcriptional regulator